MTENIKLPRKLSEERKPPPPRRPSHADVIENLDRWANSPGLQPPTIVRREDGLSVSKPARKRRHQGYARRRAKQPNAGQANEIATKPPIPGL